MLPGKTVAGEVMRVTSPCSWSIEISAGFGSDWPIDAVWTPFESVATCAGVDSVFDQLK